MSLLLILLSALLAAISGLPGLLTKRDSAWGERLSVALLVSSAILGLLGVVQGMLGGSAPSLTLPLPLIGSSVALARMR